jgi:hypothetical protein
MENSKQLVVWLTIEELQIIVYSLSSTQPIHETLENAQFQLYHKLLTKLNDVK